MAIYNNSKLAKTIRLLFDFMFLEYSLSGHKNMIMKINPDIREARHLRIWYDAGGRLTANPTANRPAIESMNRSLK